jgi:uncharacterized protein with HEPN domain
MISNRAAKFLWDVQQATERVMRFTAGRSFADYLADDMLSAAVERQFQIIGEALRGLQRVAPDLAASIPELPQIIGFRNVLVHDYENVDSQRVWGTIQNDLPALRKIIADLLRQAPDP